MLADASLVLHAQAGEHQLLVALWPTIDEVHDQVAEPVDIDPVEALELVLEEQQDLLAHWLGVTVL